MKGYVHSMSDASHIFEAHKLNKTSDSGEALTTVALGIDYREIPKGVREIGSNRPLLARPRGEPLGIAVRVL